MFVVVLVFFRVTELSVKRTSVGPLDGEMIFFLHYSVKLEKFVTFSFPPYNKSMTIIHGCWLNRFFSSSFFLKYGYFQFFRL